MITKPNSQNTFEDTLNNIQFSDVLNIEDIQHLQDLFSDATGVASLVVHPNGTPITQPSNFCRLCEHIIRKTKKGLENCYHSDVIIGRYNPTETTICPCLSGGLWDASASISVGGEHIASWLIGQVRNEELDEPRMIHYADAIGANREDFIEAFKEVPVMSVEQLKKVSKMLFAFANEVSEKAYNNLLQKIQITRQEKITSDLMESEERYKSLFQNNHAIMMLIDPTTSMIVDANPSACRYYGWTIERFRTIKISDINILSTEEVYSEMQRALKEERNHFFFRHRLANTEIHEVEVYSGPININGQKLLYSIVHDITDRKQAEQEIYLKNEQLLALNTEKDKLFSIIGHDLRGPIQTFIGLTQILTEELPSLTMDKVQKFAFSMRNSATNLYRLLENLLQWARMQQGLIPFNPVQISLLPIVKESLEMVTEPSKNKGIEIRYDFQDELTVYADKNILQTIIRNLVSNAVKFTPKGGKIIVSAITTPNNSVKISIEDSGIGMSSDMIKDLFRLDVKTNRKGTEGEASTGLGLLLCKEFIEKHDGRFWVESEEKIGSIFHFTLPSK